MQAAADEGRKSAKTVCRVIDHFDMTLNTILIGNNAVAIALSYMSTFLFIHWLPDSIDEFLASLIASVIVTILVYIFGETLPKQLGKKIPNKVSMVVVYPLIFFIIVFLPISILFYGLSILIKKIFKGKEEPEITEDDFNAVIEDNQQQGVLEDNETDIIQNSFDFTDTSVKEVLTPKEKMFTIDLHGLTNTKLISILMNTSYSRIPMYYSNPNKIVGVLIVKQYLSLYLKNHNVKISECLEKPYIVSPNIMMDNMIEGFRNRHTQVALVYKGNLLLGMITTEDVLEELVGPISEKTAGERI